MCGIAGFVLIDSGYSKNEGEKIISEMCETIRHRGPDDHGKYLCGFDSPQRVKVGLGHNRLSIIDLTANGHQPMTNEDNSIWISYNGEIYNFLELRTRLIRKGHRFCSKTDTEVIIHGYEEWGTDCVNKLNGMFAFALWDMKKNTLLLVRDRMGQKPLYYSLDKGNIIFASEPKALLRFPSFVKELDFSSLRKYFLYEYVPTPSTIYKNIKRLPTGNILLWQNKNTSIKKYWDISFHKKLPCKDTGILKDLLQDSVSKRLMSDVPRGVFLSGGLDSSSIVALMRRSLPLPEIKTFTIGFKEPSFDESEFAHKMSVHCHTTHYEKILHPNTMIDVIPEIIDFMDEPFADASIIPTYLLSQFTKGYVTVVLGGDGGDELFAGYDTFPAHKLAGMYKKIPSFIRKFFIEKYVARIPVSLNNMSLDFKLKQFLKGIPYPPGIRNQIWLGSFSPQEQNSLFRHDIDNNFKGNGLFEDIFLSLQECTAKNFFELITYLYCKFYLQDDILTKVDRASMACSLEVRTPFLDYRFVDYALSVPFHLKLHGLKTKYILRKMMRMHLPKRIVERSKKGFGIPLGMWMKNDIKNLLIDELSYEKIKKENILNPSYTRTLLKEHFKGIKDNRKQLWTLLFFELWYKRWLK